MWRCHFGMWLLGRCVAAQEPQCLDGGLSLWLCWGMLLGAAGFFPSVGVGAFACTGVRARCVRGLVALGGPVGVGDGLVGKW